MYNYGDGSYKDGRYQGYPYVSSIITDVPSVDAATAARYNHLPRRQDVTKRDDTEEIPVVYIDIPSGSGMQSSVLQPNTSTDSSLETSQQKDEIKETPVVYIDFPTNSGSNVSERRPQEIEDNFVQDTIFYDPFTDSRIERSESEDSSPGPSRPSRPATLDVRPQYSDQLSPSLAQERFATSGRETTVYGSMATDSPMAHREPPPAYSERENSIRNTTEPEVVVVELPRTIVMTPDISTGHKQIICMYCGSKDQTLIIKEAGFVTHLFALFFTLMLLLPITVLVYCTSYFKYNNHYCKLCNKKIAYEIPIIGRELTYASMAVP